MNNYGSYAPDDAVTRHFESGIPSDQYHYYYSGPTSGPTAILGVQKEYVLEGRHWQLIDVESGNFARLLEDMRNRTLRLGLFLKGYTLSGPNNARVGVWYSVFQARPVIRHCGGSHYEIIGPPSDLYERGG